MSYLWLGLAAFLGVWGSWLVLRSDGGTRDAFFAATAGVGMSFSLGFRDAALGYGFSWPAVLLEAGCLALLLASGVRHAGCRRGGSTYWLWPLGEAALAGAALVASTFGQSRPLGAILLGLGGLALAAELLRPERLPG
jgi:hypothetical protein